jgi:hypothetical protein
MRRLIALALVLAPTVALAQGRVELIPSYGYRWGGEVQVADEDLFSADVDVDSREAYGIDLELAFTSGLRFQLLASQQDTELVTDEHDFVAGESLGDVEVTYYHVGLLYQWHPGSVCPYLGGSLGLGRVEPKAAGMSNEDAFSSSFGGGFKFYLSRNVGIRVDARLFWTNIDDDEWDWDDCDHGDDCWDAAWDNDLFQQQVTVGLVLAF